MIRFWVIRLLYFLIILWSLTDCHSSKKQTPDYILKFGHQVNEGDIWHKSALYFAQSVEEKTNGKVEVQVYPAEQLGKEREMIRSIEAGIADMTTTGETMQNWAHITAFCAIPYLIRNSEHLKKVVEGEVGDAIAAQMIQKIGLRPIAYFERGARNLTSNRPIREPKDLKGIILRVPNVPIFVKTWQALGAKPTPMTFSEVFTALQQGTVEAQENPFALINSAGFYEVQKYVDLTQHVIGWVYVVIGEKKFESLPEQYQVDILEAGKEMQYYHQQLFQQEEQQLKQTLQNKGMTFIEVDKEAFQQKARSAVLESLSPALQEIYYKIESIQ